MYLNHLLVPGFPLTLRYGEERDRDYLADIFTEVWAGLPESDRAAILTRGYGQIVVDVLDVEDMKRRSDEAASIRLQRGKVDNYPRKTLLHFVARQLAYKVDGVDYPDLVARLNEPRAKSNRRVVLILERWRYPANETGEYTPADQERIRAIRAMAAAEEESQDESQEANP